MSAHSEFTLTSNLNNVYFSDKYIIHICLQMKKEQVLINRYK